jgi:hypothetical protein
MSGKKHTLKLKEKQKCFQDFLSTREVDLKDISWWGQTKSFNMKSTQKQLLYCSTIELWETIYKP